MQTAREVQGRADDAQSAAAFVDGRIATAERSGEGEAAGLAAAILERRRQGASFADMAILYRNNFLSRGYEELLMRARIPYRLVGDLGFYVRAEIGDALALLRLAAAPDDRQSDEAFRRVINEPRRGFGAKAMELLEAEAAFFNVSLLKAIETAALRTGSGTCRSGSPSPAGFIAPASCSTTPLWRRTGTARTTATPSA